MEVRCPYCGEVVQVEGKDEAFVCPSCGSHVGLSGGTTVLMRTGVVPDSLIDATLGGYRIKKLLGCGGMGRVYLAEHEPTDREVALKVLSPDLSGKTHFVERFLREARAAARLLHPNIVTVFEAGKADDHYFIAMEYVDGKSLSQIIFERGRLPEEEALRIARQIASALAYAHRQNVVHRDIKPANILITKDGVVKIADMGIAKRLDVPSVTMPGTVMGTPYYMAPEQATDSSSVDARADLYSLGATLYHTVTGKVPFDGATAPEVLAKLQVNPLTFPDGLAVSPQLKRFISRLMEKDVEKRIQTAEEAIAEIDAILSGQNTTKTRRDIGFWISLTAAVVLGVILILLVNKRLENGTDIDGLREELSRTENAWRDGRIGAKRAIERVMEVAKKGGRAVEKEVVSLVKMAVDSLSGEVRALLESLRVEEAKRRVQVRLLDYGIPGLSKEEYRVWRLRQDVERVSLLMQVMQRTFKAMEKGNKQVLAKEMFPLTRMLLNAPRRLWGRIAEGFYKMVIGRKWKPERIEIVKPTEVHVFARSNRGEKQWFVFIWVGDRWFLLRIGRKQRLPIPHRPQR